MRITETIAIVNHKGGVGKTTTAHALGTGLAFAGKKVLFLDLDQGRDLSYILNVRDLGERTDSDTSQLFTGSTIEELVICSTQGWDAIPASGSLATVQPKGKQPEYCLKTALDAVAGKYDYCIIDTPPGLGIILINALTAADSIVIPATASVFSLQRIGELSQTLEAVKKHGNPSLLVKGILLTEYQERSTLSREITTMMDEIARLLKTKVFDTRIRRYQAHGEAQARQQSIFEYDPNSNAAADYANFIREYLRS